LDTGAMDVVPPNTPLAPTSPTPPPSPKPTKKAPQLGGASRQATQKVANLAENRDPLYKAEAKFVKRERLTRANKHNARRAVCSLTDSDLHFYLLFEFAFIPRTNEVFRSMVVKAKSYLRTYDLSEYTQEQVYRLVMRAVRSALPVPDEEAILRQFLRDPSTLEEINKSADFVTTGNAGHSFTFNPLKMVEPFKKRIELPKSK